MAFTVFKNDFTGGEWSPLLDGRSDLQGYGSACARMENMRPLVHGGAVMRGGLEFVAECRTGSKPVRLIPFTFSTNTRYVLEFGDRYVHGRRGADASIVFSAITTPYKDNEVFEIQFRQVNDIMYIVHPQYAPRKLSRLSDTNWTLTEVLWDYAPLRDENINESVKLKFENNQLSAQGGSVFTSGHVGGYFELRHLKQAAEVEITLYPYSVNTSASLAVRGEWDFLTTEFWFGEIFLERSRNNGTSWEVLRQWKGQSDRNISASGRIDEEDAEQLMRIRYVQHGAPFWPPAMNAVNGDAPPGWKHSKARLETKDSYVKGLVRVTGVSSGTTAQAVVVGNYKPVSTEWTDRWSEGAWSAHRGFPRAVAFYEQRMLYGGSRSEPLRVWGSKGGDFDNFKYGDKADDAFGFVVAATEGNPILWMDALQRVVIGTSGGEFTMSGGAEGSEALSATSVSIRAQSNYGSSEARPVRANEMLIFVQRQGRKLRELVFSLERDGMTAPDLTVQSEHLFWSGGVRDLAFVRSPDPSIVVALGDCLGMLTYERESGIMAWGRYTTGLDGVFESVCGVYGSPIDEVWCVVRRRVGTQWKRFIERFVPEADNKADARYLDCHKAGTIDYNWNGGVPVGVHLNGEVLRLCVGGIVLGDYTVVGGGIHVPDKIRDNAKALWAKAEADHGSGASIPLRSYCVGLPYRGVIETMRLELDTDRGSTAGKQRRAHKLVPRFLHTGVGVKFGPSEGRLEEINFRQSPDPMDGTPPLYSGNLPLVFPLGHDQSARVVITQDKPLPFCLLGLAITAEITGN